MFLAFENERPAHTINHQMRCVMRAVQMLRKPSLKSIAIAIDRDIRGISNWLCCRINYSERSLIVLLGYLKATYPNDIDVILHWGEELYNYEVQQEA